MFTLQPSETPDSQGNTEVCIDLTSAVITFVLLYLLLPVYLEGLALLEATCVTDG